MNITVTLDASPALLDAIQSLAKGLHLVGASPDIKPVEKPKKSKEQNNLSAVTAETKETPVEQSGKDITIEMVRAKVEAAAKAGKKEKVKELLSEFGVEKVPALKQEQYSAFIEKLEAA